MLASPFYPFHKVGSGVLCLKSFSVSSTLPNSLFVLGTLRSMLFDVLSVANPSRIQNICCSADLLAVHASSSSTAEPVLLQLVAQMETNGHNLDSLRSPESVKQICVLHMLFCPSLN